MNNAMTHSIRRAEAGDEELLARANAWVQDLHVEQRPDHFKSAALPDLIEWYRPRLRDPAVRTWIAEDDGRPVGYVLCVVQHKPENAFCKSRLWWDIDQLAVEPAYRGQGVARSLIASAITAARADGIVHVESSTWAFNDVAQAVFRSLGFAPKTIRFELRP